MSEASARFYLGCVLLALEWLHERNIIHRDIKPDNLLMFADGYVKLGDLGCCCQLPPGVKASTRTGTAAYMAPEVQARQPYDTAADMWSLGVTLWHLLDGQLPTWCDGVTAVLTRDQISFPSHYSKEVCALLEGLFAVDVAMRLTVQQVQDSSWYAGFNWTALSERDMVPPAILHDLRP